MKKIVSLLTMIVAVLTAGVVFAEDHEAAKEVATAATSGGFNSVALSAGLLMAVAAAFGTLSQSRAASTALEGMARNPQAAAKVQIALVISLALIESLVIFSFAISFLLVGKV